MLKKLLIPISLCLVFSCNVENKDNDDGVAEVPHYTALTVEEFLAKAPGSEYFHLSGNIVSIEDMADSHFTLEDNTGKVVVYGLWESALGARITGLGGRKVGSSISIAARRGDFNGTPEARKAFPYDPESVKLYVSPLQLNYTSAGGTARLTLYSEDEVTLLPGEEWISASLSEEKDAILLKVLSNASMDQRTGYLYVSTSSLKEKIRVIQDAYVPSVVPISDALKAQSARVTGTVTALSFSGCVLSDESGSIYVDGKSPFMEMGAVLDVTGDVQNDGFLTSLTAHAVAHIGNTLPSYPTPEKLSASSASGAAAMKYVAATGIVSMEDGIARLRDFDTEALIAVLVQTPSADYSALDGGLVTINGFVVGKTEGGPMLLAAKASPAAVDSAVSIDGNFSDWTAINGWSGASSDVLREFKVYSAGTDIYLYAGIRSDAFTEWGEYKYFVQVYFNTDRNTGTGPVAWVFRGLDSSAYVRMTTGKKNTFNTSAPGSIFHSFLSSDGLPFVSANPNLFAGSFFAVNGSYPSAGKVDGELVRFEWKFPMGTLDLSRHSSVGVGLRFCHEGPDTPSGEQENYFLPSEGWAFYDIP